MLRSLYSSKTKRKLILNQLINTVILEEKNIEGEIGMMLQVWRGRREAGGGGGARETGKLEEVLTSPPSCSLLELKTFVSFQRTWLYAHGQTASESSKHIVTKRNTVESRDRTGNPLNIWMKNVSLSPCVNS